VGMFAAGAWLGLTKPDAAGDWAATKVLIAAAAFSLLVLFPAHAWQANRFVTPYAEASRRIAATRADIVFVDPRGMLNGNDLVRNDPFLRNRPKVMTLVSLSDAQIGWLCARYRAAVFDQAAGRASGIRAAISAGVGERRL